MKFTRRYRPSRMASMLTLALLLALPASIAMAQPNMPYGGHGYDQRGYGMMGGGMMGGGMMGGYGWQGGPPISYLDASQMLQHTVREAQVDKDKNQVTFTGQRIDIAIAAVQPGFPDTSFEVAGLVNPTIVIPAGSLVSITFINMDYGEGMAHGLSITPIPPPYPVFSMMGAPQTLAGIPVLAPRQLQDVHRSLYAEGSVTFPAPPPGEYYYLCQYYNHASKGMYGRFLVTAR